MLNWLKSIEKKFAWGVIGVLITILAFLYTEYYQKKIGVIYDVLAELNLLDLKRPIADLAITFQGTDLEQQNLNLKIFQIKVENYGRVDILQSFFDINDPWGIEVTGGRILEARLIGANSDYIKENVAPRVASEHVVEFRKIIFESQKYFLLELVVIHPKSAPVGITPVGKIAGIDHFSFQRQIGERDGRSFLARAFSGDPLVQVARSITYTPAVLVIVVISAFAASEISDYRQNRLMRRRRDRFKNQLSTFSQFSTRTQDLFIKLFERQGTPPFSAMLKFKDRADVIHVLETLGNSENEISGENIVRKRLPYYPDDFFDDVHLSVKQFPHLEEAVAYLNDEKIPGRTRIAQIIRHLREENLLLEDANRMVTGFSATLIDFLQEVARNFPDEKKPISRMFTVEISPDNPTEKP